jgi:hypothetical protein
LSILFSHQASCQAVACSPWLCWRAAPKTKKKQMTDAMQETTNSAPATRHINVVHTTAAHNGSVGVPLQKLTKQMADAMQDLTKL